MHVPNFGHRRGFTLIELLVVIALILVLATLSLLVLPRLSDDQKSVRGADQISMWLLIAKQRAYRDQAPRGLRLVPDPVDPNQVKELVYIERPVDFLGGEKRGSQIQVPAPVPPPTVVAPVTAPALVPGFDPRSTGFIHGKDLTNGNMAVTVGNMSFLVNPPIVEPGDFLVFDTLEPIPYNSHPIAALYYVPPNPTVPQGGTYIVFASPDGRRSVIRGDVPVAQSEDAGYRIVRHERPLEGEAVLQLPKDIIIDITQDTPDASGGIQGFSQFPGLSATPRNLDIVFNQRGQAMGVNAMFGKVILRVRNGSKALDQSDQLLVVVYTRTGLIAVQPLDLTPSLSGQPGYYADPFRFTKDGKASGL